MAQNLLFPRLYCIRYSLSQVGRCISRNYIRPFYSDRKERLCGDDLLVENYRNIKGYKRYIWTIFSFSTSIEILIYCYEFRLLPKCHHYHHSSVVYCWIKVSTTTNTKAQHRAGSVTFRIQYSYVCRPTIWAEGAKL